MPSGAYDAQTGDGVNKCVEEADPRSLYELGQAAAAGSRGAAARVWREERRGPGDGANDYFSRGDGGLFDSAESVSGPIESLASEFARPAPVTDRRSSALTWTSEAPLSLGGRVGDSRHGNLVDFLGYFVASAPHRQPKVLGLLVLLVHKPAATTPPHQLRHPCRARTHRTLSPLAMAFPFSSSVAAPSSQPAPLQLRLLPLRPPRLYLPPFSRPLSLPLRLRIPHPILPALPHALSSSGGGDDGGHNNNSGGGSSGDGEQNDGGNEDGAPDHRGEALFVLAQLGRKLESLPSDLAAAVEGGRVTGEIVRRFNELEGSALFRWLLQFRGFRERLLADDLFLAKLAMECVVGVIAKTAAEYEKRRENFVKEIDIVIADVVMAIVADFMLVYLPAPTVSLQPPLARNSGAIANFFHNCPDNAFQIALAGRSYSLLQRLGAILRNGTKLFAVGTSASLIGTGVTNAIIKAKKAVDKDLADEVEDIPVVSTSVAYGVYMAISSNLRYQILAGVIEQRMLEPLLHNHKLLLSAMCFAVRTGNTFLGSLLWVDYARLVGVQKVQEEA